MKRFDRILDGLCPKICDSLFCVDTSELQTVQPSDNEITALLKRLNLNSENFSERQFRRISDLITKYYSAFSINKEMGHARVDPIHINFVNEAPVRSLPYRATAADSEIINTLIDDMVSKGLALPADGRFSSPVPD